MKLPARRPSPAFVVAVIALVAAATGTATALPGKRTVDKNDLKANTVRSSSIVNNSIKSGDIKNEAIAELDLRNLAVGTAKLNDGAVTTPKIANGAVTGPKVGAITVQTASAPAPDGADVSANVDCPAGQRALAGGGSWGVFGSDLIFLSTRPIKSAADPSAMVNGEVPGAWRASGRNVAGATGATTISVWVVCLA